MEPLEQRKQELLDGKRNWTVSADAGSDYDVFLSEFVEPLRQLKYAGFFDESIERKVSVRGTRPIAAVSIVGAINYNAKTAD